MSSFIPHSEMGNSSVHSILDPGPVHGYGVPRFFGSSDISMFISISGVGIIGFFPFEFPSFIVRVGGIPRNFIVFG